MRAEKVTLAQAQTALKLGSRSSIHRYRRGERIPEPDVMGRIYLWTNGAVTPNDFYDLPALPAHLEAAE